MCSSKVQIQSLHEHVVTLFSITRHSKSSYLWALIFFLDCSNSEVLENVMLCYCSTSRFCTKKDQSRSNLIILLDFLVCTCLYQFIYRYHRTFESTLRRIYTCCNSKTSELRLFSKKEIIAQKAWSFELSMIENKGTKYLC